MDARGLHPLSWRLLSFHSNAMNTASLVRLLLLSAIWGASFLFMPYGIATTYTKMARSAEPFANAHGSMWAATLLLAPFALHAPALPGVPPLHVMLSVVALGVVCSGVAYLLYFRLIADLGAAPALTVTFLIPVFGILWGVIFLGEHMGWHTLVGGLMVLWGTALVTGFSISTVFPGRKPDAA